MHIYHSALSWTPTSSSIRRLYECTLMTDAKLVNAVGPTWDACIRIIPVAVGEGVKAVVFSPSGALIAARGECCVQVFNAMTGVNRVTFDGDKALSTVAFSPDDGFLVFGHLDGTINIWDVQTGTMSRTLKRNRSSFSMSFAFSSCGTMIASGDFDGTVRIWNILLGKCVRVFQGHSGAVKDVCWLATSNQIVSASYDLTVRIWDVGDQMCSKIFAQYQDLVTAIASSRGFLLVVSTNGTVNIYDSQSGDIIHIIRSNNISHSRFSIDGSKVLLASEHSGDIWDITTKTLTRVRSIDYNGHHVMFSPDGTRVASIYGKFLKIWKTDAGYNHHEVSTHVHKTISDVYISPQLVALKSENAAEILDVTTGQSLFTYPVPNVLSIAFSLNSAFVAFLKPHGRVYTWDAHTRLDNYFAVDDDVFHIALSPKGCQLASLSSSHMKLWDFKRDKSWSSEICLAHFEFDCPSWAEAQISFGIDGTSVSLSRNSGRTQNWHLSPNHNTDLTIDSIENSDGTKSRPISVKLPMVFVPTTEERPNQDVPAPCQSYRCDTDYEWILDQDGRRVLWIPPDERPRRIWSSFKHETKVMVIQTESGKVYSVNFLQS